MRTAKNFLVGLGYDYDHKGAQAIESGIDGIKSKALQLGTVVAGAFGIKALTADFAASNDMLGKFARYLGVDASTVQAFGNALGHEGGSLASFISQLENLERLRAGLLRGDAGWLATAGIAGIDTRPITEATDATQAYLALADQLAAMSTQQRLNAAEALGLDPASVRLLSQGRDAVEQLVAAEQSRRPVTGEMTAEAARFNDELQDLQNNIGGIADQISMRLLPAINNLLEYTNDVIENNVTPIVDVVTGDVFRQGSQGRFEEISGIRLGQWAFTPIQDQNAETLGTLADDLGRLGSHIYDTLGGVFDDGQAMGTTTEAAADVVNTVINQPQPLLFMESAGRDRQPAPQALPPPVRIEMPVILDGSVIERKVREINASDDRDALDEIRTNVEG